MAANCILEDKSAEVIGFDPETLSRMRVGQAYHDARQWFALVRHGTLDLSGHWRLGGSGRGEKSEEHEKNGERAKNGTIFPGYPAGKANPPGGKTRKWFTDREVKGIESPRYYKDK